MSSNSINLSWLTRPVESSETDTTTTTTKITGDNDTDQKINNYFNKRKKTDKASNPTDTLAEVYAKYDKNHNGKLDRSEWQAAGMTKKEAQAFNRAIKACGGDDGKIKSYALDDGSGTMYTKDGKFLFSIQSQNDNTVTTLYDDNNQPKTVTTENPNYTKTEELDTNGNPKKTTIKYTEAYSTAYNGVTERIEEDYLEGGEECSLPGKVTTCYGNAKKVVDKTDKEAIVTTYEGDLPEKVKEKSGDKTVTKKQEFLRENRTILTFEDGTQQEEVIDANGMSKTVTTKDKDGNVTETKTYNKSDTGEWEEVTEAPEPEEKPEEETGQNAALDALKAGFNSGNKISVTIQGGQTKLSSGDYQGTINLARGETFEEGKMPQTLFMTLPQGSTGKMKLTYDESTGLYTTTRGDRQFRITADNGKITMEAVTDNQEVQKKLNRNIDEWQQIKRNAINTAASGTGDKNRNQSVTPIYDSAKSTFDGQALKLDSEKIPDFSTSSLEYSTLIGQLPTQPNMSLANQPEYSYLIGGTLNYDNNGYVKSIKLDNKQELYIYRDEENKPNCLSYRNPNNNEQVFYIDPKTYSPAYYLNYSNDSADFSRYSMVNNMLVDTYKNGTYKYLIYDENRNLVGYQVISGNETSYYKSDGTKVDTKEELSDKVYFANEL